MTSSAIGGILGGVLAACLGATVAQAAPLHVNEDWLPVASDVTVGDRPVLAGPGALLNSNSIFYGALKAKVLHEIDGEDSSRLTYIFRLWNYRLGMKKRFDGSEEYSEPDPSSTPAADLIDPPIDPETPDAPDLPTASVDFDTAPVPQSPITAIPEPSAIVLGVIAAAGAMPLVARRAPAR